MTTEAGPISSALEEDVMREVPRHGIVVWLGKDNSSGSLAGRLIFRPKAGDFSEPLVAYPGSFLETMLALDPYGMGVDNEPLLVHVPGLTKLTIRETPLLALYEARSEER